MTVNVIGQIYFKFVPFYGTADVMARETWRQASVIGQIYFKFVSFYGNTVDMRFNRSVFFTQGAQEITT